MEGRDLKVARAKLGISQRELAERLGLTQVTIARYEKAVSEIPKVVEIAVECLVREAQASEK